MKRTAIILGASGLTGGHCLEYLLEAPNYETVIALVRRPLEKTHPKLKEILINFDRISDYKDVIKGNDVYCATGTTFLKSPNKQDYFRIDYTYPHEIAKIAVENGAENFALVSALSANPKAFFFYSRVKGQLEEAIAKLPYKGIYIFRPSFLIGNRKEKRPIEIIGKWVLFFLKPFLIGPFKKYRAIEAKAVAFSMVQVMKEKTNGLHIFLSDEIQKKFMHEQ